MLVYELLDEMVDYGHALSEHSTLKRMLAGEAAQMDILYAKDIHRRPTPNTSSGLSRVALNSLGSGSGHRSCIHNEAVVIEAPKSDAQARSFAPRAKRGAKDWPQLTTVEPPDSSQQCRAPASQDPKKREYGKWRWHSWHADWA